MSLHQLTTEALRKSNPNFSKEVSDSVTTILDLIENYSALSDANFLLHKYNKTIPGIVLPEEARWLPIRNLARILAKVAATKIDQDIEKIYIESMSCGCDFFEGSISLVIDGERIGGPYKWQWTAFEDRQRHYDRFTIFPEFADELVISE